MSTETMNIETTAAPEITRAAERYMEQYGDPLVMNTYLKVAILVLAGVCIAFRGPSDLWGSCRFDVHCFCAHL